MTTIKLIKTIPKTSDYYTTGGCVNSSTGVATITLVGAQEIVMNSKKSLIKIHKPQSPSKQEAAATETDQPDNLIVDLKKLDETFVIKGWLEDDASDTAWNKAWALRAMCSKGGALTSIQIGEDSDSSPPKITFGTGTVQAAHLENFTFTVKYDDTGAITTSNVGIARIEVSLAIYFGEDRR